MSMNRTSILSTDEWLVMAVDLHVRISVLALARDLSPPLSISLRLTYWPDILDMESCSDLLQVTTGRQSRRWTLANWEI